jgi:hypothetical protein
MSCILFVKSIKGSRLEFIAVLFVLRCQRRRDVPILDPRVQPRILGINLHRNRPEGLIHSSEEVQKNRQRKFFALTLRNIKFIYILNILFEPQRHDTLPQLQGSNG